jgi:hypothetical protein
VVTDLTSNRDAERAVISRVLVYPAEFEAIAADLQAGDFLHGPHAAIWRTFAELAATGDLPSVPLLKARLDEHGQQALAEAIADPPGISVSAEVREVRDCALRRRQLALVAELAEEIKAGKGADRAQALLELEDGARARERYQDGETFIFSETQLDAPVWGQDTSVLWAAGEPLYIVGPPGVGKTTIAHQLVQARIGLRDEVLGFPVAMHHSRVLYLACDRPRQIRRAFRRLFTPDDGPTVKSELVIWEGPPPVDFSLNPEALYAMARSVKADTVIVDSVKDVVNNINEPAQGQGFNTALQYCVSNDVEVLCLHHTRKRQPGIKQGIDDVYGGWIAAGAGSIILLKGEPGDAVVELRHVKQPVDDVGPLQLSHDHDAGTTVVARGKIDLLKVLTGAPGGMSAADLCELESETSNPSKNQVAAMRSRCDRLVKSGQLHRREDAGRVRYVVAAPDGS